MQSPLRNGPSICLFCSHYSHLAWQSTLFPLSPEQLKRISVFSVCSTLGLTPITAFTHDTDQRQIAFERAVVKKKKGTANLCLWVTLWFYSNRKKDKRHISAPGPPLTGEHRKKTFELVESNSGRLVLPREREERGRWIFVYLPDLPGSAQSQSKRLVDIPE